MRLPVSTIRTMHRIVGEERGAGSWIGVRLLSLQSMIDWDFWARRVDIALIGGDPIVLARRIRFHLGQGSYRNAPRIAILHSGVFSGAPLAALEDPDFRREMGFDAAPGLSDDEAAAAIVRAEADRAAALLHSCGRGGVMAFEMIQGLRDPLRDEIVLRLTRKEKKERRDGLRSSADAVAQIRARAGSGGELLYARSEKLFRDGLARFRHNLAGVMEEPREGRRFADIVIAKRCEILSGFISPPGASAARVPADWQEEMAGIPYRLARQVPQSVSDAISFWKEDFARAAKDPISSQEKEF